MNITAQAYIERYVSPGYQAYAQVIAHYALRGVDMILKPGQPVPDNDTRNVTVFIQMDTEAMPPILIPDHCCEDTGRICKDHTDSAYGHDGCYGDPLPCPYPTCPVNLPAVALSVEPIIAPTPEN